MAEKLFQKKPLRYCFDYVLLKSMLADLKYPRNAIGRLIKNGEIVRVKKGIYASSASPLSSLWVLANMIYGPSYLSQDFILSHEGLIPERVFTITSMTTKRQKVFETPLGRFEYQSISAKNFSVGVKHGTLDDGSGYLYATPEKALVDRIAKLATFSDIDELDGYLFGDMRLDRDRYVDLSVSIMSAIAKQFKKKQVFLLLEHLKREIKS